MTQEGQSPERASAGTTLARQGEGRMKRRLVKLWKLAKLYPWQAAVIIIGLTYVLYLVIGQIVGVNFMKNAGDDPGGG
jgi:hypothetical protein